MLSLEEVKKQVKFITAVKGIRETIKHKALVLWYLCKFCRRLFWRGLVHDLSKFSYLEIYYFAYHLDVMKNIQYGSDDYFRLLDEIQIAKKHHFGRNPHHPEYHKNGMSDMNLLDLIEYNADCLAASKRYKNNDFIKSFDINQKRYGFSDIEKQRFINTIKEIQKIE